MTATKFDSRGGGVTAGTCDLRAKGHLKIGSSWGEWTCEEGFKGGIAASASTSILQGEYG